MINAKNLRCLLNAANHRNEQGWIQRALIKQRRDMLLWDDDRVKPGGWPRVMKRKNALIFEDPLDNQLARQDFLAVPVGQLRPSPPRLRRVDALTLPAAERRVRR